MLGVGFRGWGLGFRITPALRVGANPLFRGLGFVEELQYNLRAGSQKWTQAVFFFLPKWTLMLTFVVMAAGNGGSSISGEGAAACGRSWLLTYLPKERSSALIVK